MGLTSDWGRASQQQTAIEKKWKELTNTRQHVLKVRHFAALLPPRRRLTSRRRPRTSTSKMPSPSTRYMLKFPCCKGGISTRCGRGWAAFGGRRRKLTLRTTRQATMKLDKAQQTVLVNERDYKHYTSVLKEMTGYVLPPSSS